MPSSQTESNVVRSDRNWIECLMRLLIAILLMLPWYSTAMLVGLIHRETGFSILVSYARFLNRLYGLRVRLENENKKPLHGCVFVLLNQTSLLDGPVGATTAPRPWRVITNVEYAMIPIFGWGMPIWGHVIVRQWPAQARWTINKASRFLATGGNILISIEGRRSKDGRLSPYKKGPVVLAIEAKADIVPVVHLGVRNCMPYGEWKIRPGNVTVRFLRSIPTRDLQYADRTPLIERLRALAERELDLAV